MQVREAMNPNVISVTPDTTVRECIKLLRQNRIRLPNDTVAPYVLNAYRATHANLSHHP
ncbi:MAG: CBS domain-containing protein [Halobacteriota archaeon]|jgi:CBS domain-containing protein